MIHLYTGEGKGKTTAAVGLAVRAAGNHMPVIFSQYLKGNDTGELQVLEALEQVTILRPGRNFGFYKNMTAEDKKEITKIHNGILQEIFELANADFGGMIVLDEITYPVQWNLIDVSLVKKLLTLKHAEIIMTGRNAPEFMVEAADYITSMECVRHPFEKGIVARKGIEF